MKPVVRWAAVAASAMMMSASSAAVAADLGGNCCADLEERIAELEATTARKGNRKVSLTVYGQVNEAVIFWDDGDKSNAYVVTNDNSRTRVGFKGDAKIQDGWKAGYMIEIGIRGNNSKRFTQYDPIVDGDERGLDIRHSYWFIDSKSYGRISVGVTGTAMEGATETNLAHTKDIAKYSDIEDSGLGLRLRSGGSVGANGLSDLTWRRLINHTGDQPGEGERRQVVKYESPEVAGFRAVAGWGTDDAWDIGLRYAGELATFKVAAAMAYGENTSRSIDFGNLFECRAQTSQSLVLGKDADCEQFGGSISVMHEPTGLYVNVAAGQHTDDLIDRSVRFAGTNADDESTFWAIEAGIEQKFFALGKTTIFGQYHDHEGGANARTTLADGDAINPFGGTSSRILSTGVEMYGVGVVQSIDAASMSLYAYYRHYEADLTALSGGAGGGAAASVDLDDLDVGMAGAIIKF